MYSEEIQTNMHKIFGESIKKIEELHQIRLNKSRTDFIASAILALVQSRNVQFWEIADKMSGDAETERIVGSTKSSYGEKT